MTCFWINWSLCPATGSEYTKTWPPSSVKAGDTTGFENGISINIKLLRLTIVPGGRKRRSAMQSATERSEALGAEQFSWHISADGWKLLPVDLAKTGAACTVPFKSCWQHGCPPLSNRPLQRLRFPGFRQARQVLLLWWYLSYPARKTIPNSFRGRNE